MEINEYAQLAMRTLDNQQTKEENLVNAAMGLAGESGEVIDLIKKWQFHHHPLDKEALIKELGDVAWYLAQSAHGLDVSLESILYANIDKLAKRYPEGFSTEASIYRKE